MAIDIVQEIELLLGRQAVADLDFEALEIAVRQQVLQLAGQAIEQRLNADLSDQASTRVRCACGREAHFAGRRAKQVHSVFGPLQLERAYYHCSACGHGYCPRDAHLRIENTSLSPALTRMVGAGRSDGQLPGRERTAWHLAPHRPVRSTGGENRRSARKRDRRR